MLCQFSLPPHRGSCHTWNSLYSQPCLHFFPVGSSSPLLVAKEKHVYWHGPQTDACLSPFPLSLSAKPSPAKGWWLLPPQSTASHCCGSSPFWQPLPKFPCQQPPPLDCSSPRSRQSLPRLVCAQPLPPALASCFTRLSSGCSLSFPPQPFPKLPQRDPFRRPRPLWPGVLLTPGPPLRGPSVYLFPPDRTSLGSEHFPRALYLTRFPSRPHPLPSPRAQKAGCYDGRENSGRQQATYLVGGPQQSFGRSGLSSSGFLNLACWQQTRAPKQRTVTRALPQIPSVFSTEDDGRPPGPGLGSSPAHTGVRSLSPSQSPAGEERTCF